nr:MAG TPA: hypothetical protein [Caudoviricetes sp.]
MYVSFSVFSDIKNHPSMLNHITYIIFKII